MKRENEEKKEKGVIKIHETAGLRVTTLDYLVLVTMFP